MPFGDPRRLTPKSPATRSGSSCSCAAGEDKAWQPFAQTSQDRQPSPGLCAVITADRARANNCDAESHSLGWWPLLRLKASGDQARAFVEAEISPSPLKKDGEAISKADQKDNVDEQPSQPCRDSAQVHQFKVCDRFVPADRRHAALVEIPEPLRLPAVDHSQNVARRVASLLHCNRRDSRQRLAGLI